MKASAALPVALVAFLLPWGAAAQDPDQQDNFEGDPAVPPPRSHYRNPEGAVLLQAYAGLATGGGETSWVLGAGVGYAVVTGVVPGVRGLVLGGDGLGGEAAVTLTLTPPIEFSLTPFAHGEAGRRWLEGIDGWLMGAGGGLYLGDPDATVNLQAGWIFRRFYLDGGPSFDVSGPLVSLSIRFD